eukprot:CAMPEP_0205944996 /NCGR_PEP_ID=MMETSP1325-20131115/64803_1 /ASSEMBLY_ACC=CAM_ASM_000708 /TAXON_ID=236786 /ORGANISM="Florenciella sp., Strain RCC1007" /LENGTH=162 /DNA_ID=CAMNT_0053315943 /DNA_START=150 /DNA_END=635 /DNA_ORIENTATION=+
MLRTDQEEEAHLVRFIQTLRFEHQSYFGIEEKNRSNTNWHSAVYELTQMSREMLPSRQLAAITTAAHQVHHEHQQNHERMVREYEQDMLEYAEVCERLQEGEPPPSPPPPVPKWVPLAADDFLPIFIFVVVQCCTQAAMPAPMRTRDLLWALADDSHLQSEA